MCLLHCQSTSKRNCMESFSCHHTGQMQGGQMGLLAAVCNSISHSHDNWWWGAFRKRRFSFRYLRWMFSVLLASPPTPQILSMMNHSELTHQSVRWNACACEWEWPGIGVLEGRRWGCEGKRMWIFFFLLPICLLFFFFKSSKHVLQEAAQLLAGGNVSFCWYHQKWCSQVQWLMEEVLKRNRGQTNKAHIHPAYTESLWVWEGRKWTWLFQHR